MQPYSGAFSLSLGATALLLSACSSSTTDDAAGTGDTTGAGGAPGAAGTAGAGGAAGTGDTVGTGGAAGTGGAPGAAGTAGAAGIAGARGTCTGGDSETEPCSVPHGQGERSRLCVDETWLNWGRCNAISCSDGSDPVDNNCPRETANTYFDSNFETATGRSNEALLDGGKWDSYTDGDLGYMEVVTEVETPDGTIYPIEGNNMLNVGGGGNRYENITVNEFLRPEDEHTYLRFYMNVLRPESDSYPVGIQMHGIQDLCEDSVRDPSDPDRLAGSTNVYLHHSSFDELGWRAGFGFETVPRDADRDYFGNGLFLGTADTTQKFYIPYEDPTLPSEVDCDKLDYYKWYRYEYHIQWLDEKSAATPAIFEIRIYDDTNTLVKDNRTMYTEWYDGVYNNLSHIQSLDELYSFDDDSRGRRIYINGLNRCIMFGANGTTSVPDAPNLYLVDKVSFGSEGWIGE